jgi:acetyl-CoA synthetase
MMRTIFRDPERFKETYFSKFPGYYNTGDGARRDQDGYYWLMGRIDDVINVSGHRIGSAAVIINAKYGREVVPLGAIQK